MRAAIAFVTLAACQGGDPSGQLDASVATDALASRVDGSQGDAAPSCRAHEMPRSLAFVHGGENRNVLLAGPKARPDKPLPLIINFHGYSDSAEAQEGFSQMSPDAEEQGFVVAYPEGTGVVQGWNAGACCGEAVVQDVLDVSFAEALIDEIAEISCIDKDLVYAVGYSNGGFLSHRLACESERFAGIGPVAGVMGMDECTPSRPIPILQIHGTADAIVPYGGNFALGFDSVDDSMDGWAERLSCSSAEPEVFFDQGDTTCVQWQGCDAPLGLCTVSGGGHTWPGGDNPIIRGATSTDLDANAMIFEFLGVFP